MKKINKKQIFGICIFSLALAILILPSSVSALNITLYWNGSEYSPTGNYTSAGFDTDTIPTYDIIALNASIPEDTTLKLQLRSAATNESLNSSTWYGPIGTTDYYNTTPSGEEINSVHNGDRWIQWIAYLATENTSLTPALYNVTINYTGPTNVSLTIWDDTDLTSKGINQKINFYANFTNTSTGEPINGSDVWCNISFNSSGSWSTAVNMTFNSTSSLYEYNKSFSIVGIFYFNVTCDGTNQGYALLSAIDLFYITSVETTLVSPPDGNISTTGNVTFICNATGDNDLENISLYHNLSGSFVLNDTWYYGGLIADANTVLLMHFNNDSSVGENYNGNGTTVYDYSNAKNNGTYFDNESVWDGQYNSTGGKFKGAFEFDGVDDYVDVSDSSSLNLTILTIEFWFKPDEDYGSNTSYVSFVYHDDYEVFIENGNMVFSYNGNNISSLTNTWDKGQWYHILVTYDGSKQTLYVNSLNESSALVSSPFTIKNNAGENVASFFNSGNMILKGSCKAGSCSYPGDDAFIIQNSSGETVAYINSTGDLCIEDSDCNDNDVNCDTPGDGSFIIQNKQGTNVTYINSTGGLCSIGTLTENGNP